MKKLFYLLLALPLVFAACEPDTPEPSPEYAYELTLTSEATMEFEAEGGEGVITFTAEKKEVTRYEPVPEPVVEAICKAEWVTDLTVDENITFTVAANEGDARETEIVVSYDDKSFEVKVRQAAKIDEPTGVQLTANFFYGDYYGDEYSPGVGNYYMKLSDLGLTEDGYAYVGGSYYYLDLYGPMFEGEGDITVPVGTYTLDTTDSCAEWTIGNAFSLYIAFDEMGNSLTGEEGLAYSDATLVVTETGATLTATINGEVHTVTFEGAPEITDVRTVTGEVVEVTVNHAYANYYGDQYTPGVADNFYFFLSDLGTDEYGWELANAAYYRFDLYTEIIDATNGVYIPAGTYEHDFFDTMAAGTFSDINSLYYVMDDSAWDYTVYEPMSSGSLTFTDGGVRAEVVIDGVTHIVTYEGDITFSDYSSSGGGSDETLSTLTDDVNFDIKGATLILEYYGDYYWTGTDNYVAYLYEDMESFNGAYLMFELLSDPAADDIAGTYSCDYWGYCEDAYTYLPGYIEGEDFYGTWYVDMLGGDIGDAMAPIADGDITIAIDADGTYTFSFDCYDDLGHAITGTIEASMYVEPAAAALSVKPAKRANMSKSAINARGKAIKSNAKVNTKAEVLKVR